MLPAHHLQSLNSIHLRHHMIKPDYVIVLVPDHGDCLRAGRCKIRLDVILLQQTFHHF